MQRPQSMQRRRSIRTSNTLMGLVSDWKAPMGQNSPHCTRRRVRTGSATTSTEKSETKITAWTAVRKDSTLGNSVTVLKGQSHTQ